MNWIAILGIVVGFVALFALTGIQPKETRKVAGTRMIKVARIVLVVIALILLAVVMTRSGGG